MARPRTKVVDVSVPGKQPQPAADVIHGWVPPRAAESFGVCKFPDGSYAAYSERGGVYTRITPTHFGEGKRSGGSKTEAFAKASAALFGAAFARGF